MDADGWSDLPQGRGTSSQQDSEAASSGFPSRASVGSLALVAPDF